MKFLILAEILKAEEYQTGYIGKWHPNGHQRGEEFFSSRDKPLPAKRRQGWDYWKGREVTITTIAFSLMKRMISASRLAMMSFPPNGQCDQFYPQKQKESLCLDAFLRTSSLSLFFGF